MGDTFGRAVSLAADGNTLAVGANGEDSNATGIGGNQADNSVAAAGAVYLYWHQYYGSATSDCLTIFAMTDQSETVALERL